MKLIEALKIASQPAAAGAKPFGVFLACGFNPLHLQTLLKAHLQVALPERAVSLATGQYGSLVESLASLSATEADQAVVVMEWPDVDPRLGLRHLGGWTPSVLEDIVATAEQRLGRLLKLIEGLNVPVVVVLPTLALPPAAFTSSLETSRFDRELQKLVAGLAAGLPTSTVVLKASELDRVSPISDRHDISSELSTGFPYSRGHADVLASLLTRVIAPPPPKKGLITDLDDTLWLGILGDDGVDGVSWDLDHQSQMHGAYQQLLRSLAESGVLLAVASKNDAGLVDKAFERKDLLIQRGDLFPLEVHWHPKSESVTRILEKWNIGADSVVFIDDSPMELAEVKEKYPAIECLRFPKEDPSAIYQLMHRLRDVFGKREIREEDRIRAQSIRHRQVGPASLKTGESLDRFLEDSQPRLSFSYTKEPLDARILELINKTNQFNLNGRRYLEREWQTYAMQPETVILLVSYEDKYGPLGKIAAVAGRLTGKTLEVDTWVMSCRAFSRRIEHQTVQELFERFGLEQMTLHYEATERNGPLLHFLQSMDIPTAGSQPVTINRDAVESPSVQRS